MGRRETLQARDQRETAGPVPGAASCLARGRIQPPRLPHASASRRPTCGHAPVPCLSPLVRLPNPSLAPPLSEPSPPSGHAPGVSSPGLLLGCWSPYRPLRLLGPLGSSVSCTSYPRGSAVVPGAYHCPSRLST